MNKPRRYKIAPKAERQVEENKEILGRTRKKNEMVLAAKAKAKARTVCGHEPGCVPMPFMGYITWTDPQRKPDVFALRICCTPDGEFANVCMKIPTRDVASLELRPARRPMNDRAGHVADAIRLAGGDTTA